MEFPKSCRTNVQLAENIQDTPCHVYTSDGRYKLFGLLAELRVRETLCAVVGQQLWVFGVVAEDVASIIGAAGHSELKQKQQWNSTCNRVLLEAMQGAISFKLRQTSNAFRVGVSTWLFQLGDDEGWIGWILLHLDMQTTDSGTLFATITTKPSHLAHLSDDSEPDGEPVVLAPFGTLAKLATSTPIDTVIAGESWQTRVIDLLRAEGMELDGVVEWATVQISGDTSRDKAEPQLIWPWHLCLAKAKCHFDSTEDDWKRWFASPGNHYDSFKNPLADAESWFLGTAERQKVAAAAVTEMAKTKSEHGRTFSATHPMSTSLDMDTLLAMSPFSVQRNADQQASMGGIYPTPEDNLMPSTGMPSQQPSSDTGMAPLSHGDSGGLQTELLPTSDDLLQARGHSSSSDPPAFLPTDDLFGDIVGMDFGGGEVGDADFDFFNEEEETRPGSRMTMGDVHMEMPETEKVVNHSDKNGAQPSVEPGFPKTPVGELTGRHQAMAGRGTLDESFPEIPDKSPRPGSFADTAENGNHMDMQTAMPEPERPLTPLTIKELLMRPPVPASITASAAETANGHRRTSAFDPVAFREGLDLRRYSTQYGAENTTLNGRQSDRKATDISLPRKQKKPRALRPKSVEHEAGETGAESSESEADSYETASSLSDPDLPPKLPWIQKKRKRRAVDSMPAGQDPILGEGEGVGSSVELSSEEMRALLARLIKGGQSAHVRKPPSACSQRPPTTSFTGIDDILPTPDELFANEECIVSIAQIVSDQAVSCTPTIVQALDIMVPLCNLLAPAADAVREVIEQVLEHILPDVEACDLSKLALTREPPANRAPHPAPNSSRPIGQPRFPAQRADSVSMGSDIVAVPPPYIRVKRGNDTMEMLPPVLSFWDETSLAPVSGPKPVRAFCVFPDNEDLGRLVAGFLGEIGDAYETCKLGSHVHTRDIDEDIDEDEYENGLVPVQYNEEKDGGTKGALWSFSSACSKLGAFLAGIGHLEPENTVVLYMVNPFLDDRLKQHLCACFWVAYQAYRDNVPFAHRTQPRSDIVLQLIPVELIASPDTIVILKSKQRAALAKEVYGRCPPSNDNEKNVTSALPYFMYAAPLLELASPTPKRINFQLTADPPGDLLHEGSVLHIAYVLSADRLWMTVVWMDSTGRYQRSESFCMRGWSFTAVVEDVWDRTRDILAAREVTWRIFIVTTGEVGESYRRCWKKIIGARRKQPFSVTLLSAEMDPELRVTPLSLGLDEGGLGHAAPSANFLTPTSTPKAAAMTVSPDTNGYAAPLTPVPMDSASIIAESDPESHYVDLRDESWAVFFSPAYSSSLCPGVLATGALVKRGEEGMEPGKSNAHVPCLAVHLLWTVQVRPNGNVDEGNVRQAEMTLRDVLRMWRNLSVLTKARALGDEKGDVVPVHLETASRGAVGLEGYLSWGV
ncbi:hypothetical protein LTR08_002926 [Meristemomyces frigidus]|nr:hypothetical protein LTR08_002926 [Meristemomyces frigidus]